MKYTGGTCALKSSVWFFVGEVLELPGKDVAWYLQKSDGLVAPGQPGAPEEEGGELSGAAGLDITWLPLDVAAE